MIKSDPHQLRNLFSSTTWSDKPHILGRELSQVVTRLDALLLVLKSCQGPTCIEPWNELQPNESVRTLRDALDGQHDALYSQQPPVSFEWCDAGYVIEAEGPRVALTSRHGASWDIWV